MNETEVLRCIREELIDVEEFMDKLFSQKMNRMKESMYMFKELELSDEQIADLLGLVYKDSDEDIDNLLSTFNKRSYLINQLYKSLEIIRHNTESLIHMYNDIKLRDGLIHYEVNDHKAD